jgi:cyclase
MEKIQFKKIIPCLDIDEGNVVKGVKFEGIKQVGDPIELAKRYFADGADELAFLDISASVKGRSLLLDIIRKITNEIDIPLCVGGGIKSVDDMRNVIDAGAKKVSVCTSAILRPELLREMSESYGNHSVVLAIDAKRVNKKDGLRWNVFSHGGRTDTGLDAIEWAIQAVELGAGEIMVNSIDADGTGEGYDLELTRRIINAVPVPIIASGGAGSLEQIAQVLISTESADMDNSIFPNSAPGAHSALVASLLHFGKTSIQEIKRYLATRGIEFYH